MAEQWAGKSVLVTGGASGIGRATCVAFAAGGANVVVADWDEKGGKATVRQIRTAGGEAFFIRTDVADGGAVESLVKKTVKRHGRLDCAFNNAGIGGKLGLMADYDEADWHRVIAVNLTGVWLCMKHELQQMLKQGGGAIVNTASIAGLVGLTHVPAYCAAKHGVVGLTRAAALENAKRNIRVNAVCPGGVRTPMLEEAAAGKPQFLDAMAAQEPVGRLAEPEEIASAVLWLCSDAASFVTGHALAVDGGWVAR